MANKNPVVFQCSTCRTILSDSHELVCTLTAPDGLNFIAVNGMCDARVDRIALTVVTNGDRATHFTLCCNSCGSAVGRVYTEVAPGPLASVRNLFCLEVESCLSYQLGSADVRAPSSAAGQQLHGGSGQPSGAQQQQEQQQDQQQDGGSQPSTSTVDGSRVLDLLARVEHLEASLLAMQGMQLLHDAQLRTLPNYQAEAAGG